MPPTTTTAQQHNRRDQQPATPMAFQWRRCPQHPVLILSVIVTPDSGPWCIGDAVTIPGHRVEVAA